MKISTLFTTPTITSICNIIILLYGLNKVINIIENSNRTKYMKNLTLFFKILFYNIKENMEIFLSVFIILIIFIILGLQYTNVQYLHAIFILLISSSINVLITFLIFKTIETLQKIKFENKFELTKNIYIDIVNNIINSFGYLENGKPYNNIVHCTNINTPNIEDKFPTFKITKEIELPRKFKYMKLLTNSYYIDLTLLKDWVIPSFKRQAITNQFYKSLNQIEFEINRIIQLRNILKTEKHIASYNDLSIKYSVLRENLLNHLQYTLKDFWEYLYEEYHNFYKYID